MHITTISEKGRHELEREHGGLHERVWREGRKRRNDVIIV